MLAQSIIGTAFYSGGGGGSAAVGTYNLNGTITNYDYTDSGTPGIPSLVNHNFPNGSTGNIISLDGSCNLMTASLGEINNFWLNIWIYPSSNNVEVLSEVDSPSAGYYYNMIEIDSDGYVHAGIWTGSAITSVTSTNKVTLNAWNHLYFYHNNGTIQLEVNGGTAATQSGLTRSGPAQTRLSYGQSSATNMVTSTRYQGYIDVMEVHDVEHGSSYSVTKDKYQAQQVLGLLGSSYAGSGSTWTDSVGSKAFTLYNSPTWSNTNGGQFRFASASSQFADSTSLSSMANFSVQGVFKIHSAPVGDVRPCLITEYWPGNGTKINYTIGYINTNYRLDGGFFDSNNGFWNVLQFAQPTLDTWYDLTVTFNGTSNIMKTYINGVLSVEQGGITGTAASDNAGIRIARRWDTTDYLDCTIKDIKIWNGVLTDAEVALAHTQYNSLI